MPQTETEIEAPKQGRQRRGSGLPTLVRELQRMTEAYTAKLAELAKVLGEELTRKAEEVQNEVRLAEAREHGDHAKVRAGLNTITGGAVERLVRVSKEEDTRRHVSIHGRLRTRNA